MNFIYFNKPLGFFVKTTQSWISTMLKSTFELCAKKKEENFHTKLRKHRKNKIKKLHLKIFLQRI